MPLPLAEAAKPADPIAERQEGEDNGVRTEGAEDGAAAFTEAQAPAATLPAVLPNEATRNAPAEVEAAGMEVAPATGLLHPLAIATGALLATPEPISLLPPPVVAAARLVLALLLG